MNPVVVLPLVSNRAWTQFGEQLTSSLAPGVDESDDVVCDGTTNVAC